MVTIETRPRGGRDAFLTGAAITAGMLVGEVVGELVPWADTANYEFMGIALEDAADGTYCRVNTHGDILVNVTVTSSTQSTVGSYVYSSDSDASVFQTSATNTDAVGRCIRFHSGDLCDIELFTPAEHRVI